MSVISGIPEMTEEEMEAVAKYIASINLEEHDPNFTIHHAEGDPKKGAEIFQEDCKDCHGKKGQGKPRKGAPFLRGQYAEYIDRQIAQFNRKEREHDRDPEDETFDDYKPEELNDIIDYVTTLDDKAKPAVAKKPREIMKEKEAKGDHVFAVAQTVLKMPLKEGVTAEDARQAMLSKAAEVNLKMVGNQMVHEEVRARGIETGILEIYQFCDPEDAVKMVRFNPLYAAYMPCRVALVEDADNKLWLTMINLDFLIENVPLPEDLRTIAININGKMLEIISAASTGEF